MVMSVGLKAAEAMLEVTEVVIMITRAAAMANLGRTDWMQAKVVRMDEVIATKVCWRGERGADPSLPHCPLAVSHRIAVLLAFLSA
jgi:hypothetical protein